MTTLPATPLPYSQITLAALAREMVMGINPPEVILEHFKLQAIEYAAIEQLDAYKAMLASAKAEWEGAKNTAARLQVQALAGLEDTLPTVVARLQREDEPLNNVVEGVKVLKAIGGIGESGPGKSGEKFVININMGEDKEHHVIDITPAAAPDPGTEGSGAPVQQLPQRGAEEAVLRPIPQGDGPVS